MSPPFLISFVLVRARDFPRIGQPPSLAKKARFVAGKAKGWQEWLVTANHNTRVLKILRKIILCGKVKPQVVQGKVRNARYVSVTYPLSL